MKTYFLIVLIFVSGGAIHTQENSYLLDSVNVALDKYTNHAELFSNLNSIEVKGDSIYIHSIIRVKFPSQEKEIDVKTIYSYYPPDIQTIYNGQAPAKNWVIYLKTKGKKIGSCSYESSGKLKECSHTNIQNLILGKMSKQEIKSTMNLLITIFNSEGSSISMK